MALINTWCSKDFSKLKKISLYIWCIQAVHLFSTRSSKMIYLNLFRVLQSSKEREKTIIISLLFRLPGHWVFSACVPLWIGPSPCPGRPQLLLPPLLLCGPLPISTGRSRVDAQPSSRTPALSLFAWATVGTGPVVWSRHPSGLSWLHEHTLAYLQAAPVLTPNQCAPSKFWSTSVENAAAKVHYAHKVMKLLPLCPGQIVHDLHP